MDTFLLIAAIIGFIASLITIFAVSGNIANYIHNYKNYCKGGKRIIYISNAYRIFRDKEILIYQSSKTEEDYIVFREKGKIEHREKIKPFREWTWSRRFDDIRIPNYPIQLL